MMDIMNVTLYSAVVDMDARQMQNTRNIVKHLKRKKNSNLWAGVGGCKPSRRKRAQCNQEEAYTPVNQPLWVSLVSLDRGQSQ